MRIDHFVGEVGTALIVDCKKDITRSKKYLIYVKKPSGKEVIWTGVCNGTTKTKYIIKKGDLNEAGIYKVQVYLEMSDFSGWTTTGSFPVKARFN